jgi:hypothetical protein
MRDMSKCDIWQASVVGYNAGFYSTAIASAGSQSMLIKQEALEELDKN